jgi:hypothetical protein
MEAEGMRQIGEIRIHRLGDHGYYAVILSKDRLFRLETAVRSTRSVVKSDLEELQTLFASYKPGDWRPTILGHHENQLWKGEAHVHAGFDGAGSGPSDR